MFNQHFTNMDPKKEGDKKFRSLPLKSQLEILIRYRDKYKQTRDAFLETVSDYGLEQEYIHQMTVNNIS